MGRYRALLATGLASTHRGRTDSSIPTMGARLQAVVRGLRSGCHFR